MKSALIWIFYLFNKLNQLLQTAFLYTLVLSLRLKTV